VYGEKKNMNCFDRRFVDLKPIIYQLLSENGLYRSNDYQLIMEVCRVKGYCKYSVVNGRGCWMFYDDNSNAMPRSFFDTVRRTRQKLQADCPELRPSPEFVEARRVASEGIRKAVKGQRCLV
jgi:hypothetical protein